MKQLIVALVILSAAAADPPAIPDAGRTALSGFLRETVARGDVPAVVALVVNRDAVLFLDAAGKRDVAQNAPLAPDAIFRIASMTKPVTSLAVMMLHEEGKIGLDDPVTKYLPEFEKVRVLTRFNGSDGTYDARPPARPITIRHLLTHTSGIGYSFSDARLAKLDDGKKSVTDYGTFLQLFLNGGRHGSTRLITEASLRLMTSNQIGSVVVERQPSANAAITMPFPIGSGKDKFGLGFQIETDPIADRGMREATAGEGSTTPTSGWIRRRGSRRSC